MVVEKLKPYMKETPIVTVRMVNYKISVIGEVTRPGTFTIIGGACYGRGYDGVWLAG